MKRITLQLAAFVLPLAGFFYVTQSGPAETTRYSGMCDASAVVSLDDEYFAVADDEETIIRVYSQRRGGRAVHALNVAPFLGLPRRAAEVDLEGAARLGDRVYWISSHGCNAEGREQPSRRRFFATTGSVSNGVVDLRPVGKPYSGLLEDLIQDPRLARFKLLEASRLPPKAPGALNIEALGATADGHLLIGFRNPIPDGQALIVPLLNPSAVVDGTEKPRFGEPRLLNLRGLGFRSLAWRNGRHWIVAGSPGSEAKSRLYHWTGGTENPRPVHFPELAELNPESVTFFGEAEATRLWIVSDDGNVQIGGVDCKRLKDSRLKQFRAMSVPLHEHMAVNE